MAPNSVRSVDVVSRNNIANTTNNASSIGELIQTLPQTWRPSLSSHLNTVYRVATKLCTVQNTIAQYERHQADNSFPGSINNSLREPKVQFSKEFLGTEEGRLADGLLKGQALTARTEALKQALALKKQEIALLQKLTAWDKAKWHSIVAEVATRVAIAFDSQVKVNIAGKLEWDSNAPPNLIEEGKVLWDNGSVFHYRVITLARSLADRSLVQKTKNLSLKTQTDTEMRDIDTEKSTRDLVKEEMQAQLRLLETRLAKSFGQSPGKRHGSPLTTTRTSKKVRPSQRPAEQFFWRQEEWLKKEPSTEEEKERTMTVQSFLNECSKGFRVWLPETYPTVYGELSSECRLKIGFALSRAWETDTAHTASPGIFKHDSVDMPDEIEYTLAVNHKFILHQEPLKHDVEAAKTALARTIRNRWFFRDKEKTEFIPKFHVANKYWTPPKASSQIEQGLQAALEMIDAQVHQAFVRLATRPATRKFYNWNAVQEFLEEKNLLVKLTDKNLGLAAFPVSWYDNKVLEMLADTNTYRPEFNLDPKLLRDKLNDEVLSWKLPPSMDKYITQKTLTEIPEFHAIPKVHKTPWTIRPIVPSHSWVTSTTSTVLDHLCQPLLKHMPWIVASSKEVINHIEKTRIKSTAPVWIMTGDVVSFYSNIPPRSCAKITAGLWKEHCSDSTITPHTIRRMCRFIMENNYLSYRGQKFHQINGLAMGTACAPVLANLYAGFYEKRHKIPGQKGVLLYNRYIDDILCLFQGTEEEAVRFCEKVRLGPLSITWSCSILRNEFLDIEIIKSQDRAVRVVDTRLFRKKMNRHLYIPWSSAHPLHVKKGFVKAELTRLTMLCSDAKYFADARQEFYGNLRRRGYPSQTLIEWFSQVSYGDRPILLLPKNKEQDQAPLMLPGHYNPVWDFVDVKEVISAAKRFWNQEELPDSLQEPLIRSLGKTTSLFDLLSSWNKTILLSLPDGE